jgi:hypothetical protein
MVATDRGRAHGRKTEAMRDTSASTPREEPPRVVTHGTARVVPAGRRQVRIRKSGSRRLRDLPELDLRTPSGRMLPF